MATTDLDPERLDEALHAAFCTMRVHPGVWSDALMPAVEDALVTYGVPDLHSRLRELEEENAKLRLALSRGWNLSQYEYADAHDLWAQCAGEGMER